MFYVVPACRAGLAIAGSNDNSLGQFFVTASQWEKAEATDETRIDTDEFNLCFIRGYARIVMCVVDHFLPDALFIAAPLVAACGFKAQLASWTPFRPAVTL